ncbi:T9SS type A sorting domain-containing protein [Lacinutrix sp. Bg11-31]|uniref:T9SS type A sorting domain-containing protein n=1 Tax=Lacinutrix sp. Bg11-31 TaxID=2057808 RepID=UPI000C30422A|nr:T9SS type A sorting domain-containing protein [Lacinutrix sp. Bg11-31]AUC82191.1 T9SS C-terminal target domain-containing protein [Lacinutrix sp. Bg11-31]
MKQFYSLLLTLLAFGFLNAQIVNIPDTAFKQILLEYNCVDTDGDFSGDSTIDLNGDGEIQNTEAEAVINLIIPIFEYVDPITGASSNISDITGLEAFSSIEILFLDGAGTLISLSSIDLGANNQSLVEIKLGFVDGLQSLDLGLKPNLTKYTSENTFDLTTLDFSECPNLENLYCGMTNLTSLDITQNTNLINFGTDFYYGLDIDFTQNINLETISFVDSSITSIDLSNCVNLINFYSQLLDALTALDFSGNPNLQSLQCQDSGSLETLNIKNNSQLTTLDFSGCSFLTSICVDDTEFDMVSNLVNQYGYTDCAVTNYCTLNPAGATNFVEGVTALDLDNNGCDISDLAYGNLRFNITNGTTSSVFFTDNSGDYSIPLQDGINTITPQLENANYFNITPASVTIDFTIDTSPFSQDFCIAPNGVFNDLEVVLIPIGDARPGFDANYKLVYKNSGNTTLSGNVSFAYLDDTTNFVSAVPIPDSDVSSELMWSFIDLLPFESREIDIVINLNTPTDVTFPLNGGDLIAYTANVTPLVGDETPINNNTALRQMVVNSFDPNDKACLEGNEIDIDRVGESLNYRIRFENTGTASAINIVVKDVIDTSKFDMATFTPLYASHDFVTRIENNNEVKFVFENINLPFDDANNDGYVIFKIKTVTTLVIDDTFSNQAEIYFDFNFPIITNNETVTVVEENLSVSDFDLDNFEVYPNPVKDILKINSQVDFDSILIFNITGQFVKEIKGSNNINIEDLDAGIYFVKLEYNEAHYVRKIIKI